MTSPPSHDSTDAIAAGSFGEWLTGMRAVLRGHGGTAVPCGDCVGCCVSSYHVPIRPADREALRSIPAELLVRAPGMAPDHRMMRHHENGLCPMLEDRKCTIYSARPQTCRDYDCRIFAAAGIDAGGPDKHVINRRVRAWRFSYGTEADRATHEAVLATSAFIEAKRDCFPGERAPTAPTGIAVLAIKAYTVFLEAGSPAGERPRTDRETAIAIIDASRKFDAGS
jgi:Fe-S-cluster containining protein